MNFLQIVGRVWLESQKQGFGPATMTAASKDAQRIGAWVNDALQNLVREQHRKWDWLNRRVSVMTTLADTSVTNASLGLTDVAFWRTFDRRYAPRIAEPSGASRPLQWLPLDVFNSRMELTAGGLPIFWSLSRTGELLIGPAPAIGSTITAEYFAKEPMLVADTDTPLMPEAHHMYLVWRALVESGLVSVASETHARAVANTDEAYRALIDDQGETIHWSSLPLA